MVPQSRATRQSRIHCNTAILAAFWEQSCRHRLNDVFHARHSLLRIAGFNLTFPFVEFRENPKMQSFLTRSGAPKRPPSSKTRTAAYKQKMRHAITNHRQEISTVHPASNESQIPELILQWASLQHMFTVFGEQLIRHNLVIIIRGESAFELSFSVCCVCEPLFENEYGPLRHRCVAPLLAWARVVFFRLGSRLVALDRCRQQRRGYRHTVTSLRGLCSRCTLLACRHHRR
jgi:hypothetical protein